MDSDTKILVAILMIVLITIPITFAIYPEYRIYSRELRGKADLREAEWNSRVQIERAKANLEAEKLNAQSEVERAKGVAEANKIIGDSLKNNDAYLRYLWINGLHDGSSETIYIPTEANLPILEATRFK